jgi:hypothetical protein
MTHAEINPIIAPLVSLPFEQRVYIAHALGLSVECCASCGCYAGADYCHPADAVASSEYDECECPDRED